LLVVTTVFASAPQGAGVERSGSEPAVLWHVAGEGRGTPAVDASSVYFLTKRHEVIAAERLTGRVRWRTNTGQTATATTATWGSLALVAGPVVAVGDYDVVAFDRETGQQRWRFVSEDGYAAGVYLGAADDSLIVSGSPSGRVYAIAPESGRARWSTPVATDGKTTVFQPVMDDSIVAAGFTDYVGPNAGGIALIARDSGRMRWKVSFPPPTDRTLASNWAGGPVLVDDLVIAASGDGNVYAFARENGAVKWMLPPVDLGQSTVPIAVDRDVRPLCVSGRTLVAGSLTGIVTAYDLDTRQTRWRFGERMWASVAFRLSGDRHAVYIPYYSGELIAVDMATGVERWRIGDWKRGFLWPALVTAEALFAAASGDGFYAMSPGASP
jgi:outer membrane protein assembly factor BamB